MNPHIDISEAQTERAGDGCHNEQARNVKDTTCSLAVKIDHKNEECDIVRLRIADDKRVRAWQTPTKGNTCPMHPPQKSWRIRDQTPTNAYEAHRGAGPCKAGEGTA